MWRAPAGVRLSVGMGESTSFRRTAGWVVEISPGEGRGKKTINFAGMGH